MTSTTTDQEAKAVEPGQKQQEKASTGQMYPSVDLVHKICTWSRKSDIAISLPLVIREMAAKGLTSKNALVAVIATIHAECMWDAGLIEQNVQDGVTYGKGSLVGRGLVQLTHRGNYERAGKALGIPNLADNPELALIPENAAKIFFWFWEHGSSRAGESMTPFAEAGDWENIRSIVNAGSSGKYHTTTPSDKFMPTIERSLQMLEGGINAEGLVLSGTTGASDFDAGDGPNVTMTGQHNPTSQLSALEYALGMLMLDYHKALILEATLDVAAQPDVLKLDSQLTLESKGFGEDANLDDTYTIDEVLFTFGDRLECEVVAYKPNKDAPRPMLFAGDASQPLAPVSQVATQAGSINERIYKNSLANQGQSTADGPGGGNVACAFAVNKFSMIPSGIPPLGGGTTGSDYVPTCVEDMESGRADKVSQQNSQPGDIWVSFDMMHIGVVTEAGGTAILSNSSSKASFSWEVSDGDYANFYGGQSYGYYRIKS
jgi:predicted chitinase